MTMYLSNKGCRHYYMGTPQCRCPEDRCWYQEMATLQKSGQPTQSPREWEATIAAPQAQDSRDVDSRHLGLTKVSNNRTKDSSRNDSGKVGHDPAVSTGDASGSG